MMKDAVRVLCMLSLGLMLTSSLGCATGGGGGGSADDGTGGGSGGGGEGDDGSGGGGGDDGTGGGSNQNANDNTNDNDGGGDGGQPGELTVVDTGANVHVQSHLSANDRYIAYQNNESGTFMVQVLDTLDNNTVHTLDNEHTSANNNDFAVADSWVIARGNDLGIYAFNVQDPSAGTNQVGDTLLGGTLDGKMNSDGGNIVALGTTDGALAWIDVSSNEPVLTKFARPRDFRYQRWHVWGTQIAVLDGDNVLIFDTANPAADPITWPASVDTDIPISYNGSYVIYLDNETEQVTTLNVANGAVTSTGKSSSATVGIGGDNVICGFSNEDSFGATVVGFIGTAGQSGVSLAPDQDFGNRTSPGWGTECAVSGDGTYVFSSGSDDPTNSQSDLLAAWINGANPIDEFAGNYVPDIDGTVSAAGVTMGQGLVAFRLFTGESLVSTIGYIVLP